MSEKCKLCGFSAAAQPDFPGATAPYTPLPQFLPFIVSNQLPSPAQESVFRQMLAESIESVKYLDNRIETMRRDLEALVRRRSQKEREVTDYKSVLHPIRRLPREILCEIFLSCVIEDLGDREEEEISYLAPSSTIWILPHVSSLWRSVALSFPRMWSTVRLVGSDPDDLHEPSSRLPFLQAQLQRSASHQLTVCLAFLYGFSEDLRPLLSMLFSTSHRWKDVLIWTDIGSLGSYFSPLRNRLPSLTTLSIWNSSETAEILTPSELTMFEVAPALTTLVGHADSLYEFKLPFSHMGQSGLLEHAFPVLRYSPECRMYNASP
ncbi:hypothetical protein C8J56DRAFT_1025469 [Mycena floridula]|nr:hypothetical protein C8J56DRAFT_1025469 [Mycena floridula]